MNVSTSDRNNTPPDLSRNVAERNVDNTESACFGKAIRRFQEKHPDKFKVLLSISPKKSLAYEDILASFKLVADKQNENNNLRRCLGRLCETLQQFKQTALTGARADAVAPYVVGGLFVFMQVLPTIKEGHVNQEPCLLTVSLAIHSVGIPGLYHRNLVRNYSYDDNVVSLRETHIEPS